MYMYLKKEKGTQSMQAGLLYSLHTHNRLLKDYWSFHQLIDPCSAFSATAFLKAVDVSAKVSLNEYVLWRGLRAMDPP